MDRIWDDREAENWNEAYPLGNGFLGAMVFGGTGVERIQINEDSLWSGGPIERTNPDAKNNLSKVRELLENEQISHAEELAELSMYGTYPHMRHYQTLGDVWIDFLPHIKKKKMIQVNGMHCLIDEQKEVSAYSRELNLDEAIQNITYMADEIKYERECFASSPDSVIAYDMRCHDGNKLNFQVFLTRKDNRRGRGSSFCDGNCVYDDSMIRLYGTQGGTDGIGFELAVKVMIEDGTCRRMGSHLLVENASRALLYITARTTYRSEDPWKWCREKLDRLDLSDYESVKKRHIKDYQKLYYTSRLLLPRDERLECLTTRERLVRIRNEEDPGLVNLYYNFSRYLLISSSRKGSLPANLQGIWNEEFEPMWGSKYTININIEMNYWMAEKGGLSELHMPLLEHLKKMRERGRKVAMDMYGARGFCCHHNTDIWGDCAPQDNNIASTIWPLGGAWLCLHLIQHYRYTKDQEFLKEYYPILCDCVLFFVDYMVQDTDGYWITGPSSSPENTYITVNGEFGRLCMGPTMDSEILHELFGGYLEIEDEVGEHPELQAEIRKRYEHLPPLKTGRWGQIMEWRKDYEEAEVGHRHISQLFALYPGTQIRPDETPELAEAAEHTLERRLTHGGGHTGWSKAWVILFYARLHQGDASWENIRELLADATHPNLFDNHPPFQIDGNFGGACGVAEMLVQDFGDKVYILPALPGTLPEGELTGIRLQNGAVLNLRWKNGTWKEISVRGLRDTTFTLVDEEGTSIYIKLRGNEEKNMIKEEQQ